MAILSFLGNTFIAYRILDEGDYPGAQLFVMEATFDPPKPEGSTNVKDLNSLKGIFGAPKGDKPGTAYISSNGWGEWGPVKYINLNYGGCYPIPMPDEKYMDPEEAHKKMVAKGYDGPFFNMSLRKPLAFGVTEPKYIFAMDNNVYVLVGAITGTVEKQHGTSSFEPQDPLQADA